MSYPANYFILFGFTVCEGFLLGIISSVYDTSAVLIAGLITVAVTVSLIGFAVQTKFDFTGMGGYALCFLVVFILAGIVRIFVCKPGTCDTFEVIYAAIGALLFSFLLVYHTQLIVGGEDRRYQFQNNDYVIAALSLYLDIINLFTFILRLVGGSPSRR
jgi:FtsH-binding integral membrane protein